jgi:hypothetical protein
MIALLLGGCPVPLDCPSFETLEGRGAQLTIHEEAAAVVRVAVSDQGDDFHALYTAFQVTNQDPDRDCVVAVYVSEVEPDLGIVVPLDPVENVPADHVDGLGDLLAAMNLPPASGESLSGGAQILDHVGEAFVTVVTCGDAPVSAAFTFTSEWVVTEEGADCDGVPEERVTVQAP